MLILLRARSAWLTASALRSSARLAASALALCLACTPRQPELTPGLASAVSPASDARALGAPDLAPVTDQDVTEARVNGLHVLVKRVPGIEQAATQLYIQGGVRNYDASNAGVERLALQTSVTGGTERLNKDAFTQRLTELGSTIDAHSGNDFSVIGAWSLTPAWQETFELLSEALLHPALDATQLELLRAQQLSELRHEQEDPDSRLRLLVHRGIYAGHPYQHRAIGTLQSVAKLQEADLRAHLAKLGESSRLLLVVVGDLAPEQVIESARRSFRALPRGTYQSAPLPPWSAERGHVSITVEPLPTTYVAAVFPGPRFDEPDLPAGLVAMNFLNHRLFEEVRTKRNLSYAPAAALSWQSELTRGLLYVTATDPKRTLQVMLDEARKLRDAPLGPSELDATKAPLLTSLALAGEAPSDQATELGRAQILGGDWRGARTFSGRVRAVTAEQVQAFAQARLTKLQTFVLSNQSPLDVPFLEAF